MADANPLPEVTLYTDGGADPNPGAGGWAAILLDPASGKAKEIVAILESNGIGTATLITRRPGYIVYEDYHQIAAIPFRDTFLSERKR